LEFKNRLLVGLALAWILAFGIEAASTASWAWKLAKLTGRMQDTAVVLEHQAERTAQVVRETRSLSQEQEFLQSLPNILPQDKGYVRTQKAVSDEVESLREKLSRSLKGSLYVLVDAKTGKLYLKKGFKLLWQADCSVGRGGTLVDRKTGRRWQFVTPRGEFKIISKGENALWRKPDWAYVEAKEAIPPPDDPKRLVAGELGAYFLNLGDGYLIHGTKDEKTLGRPASHGCVRMGAADLKALYEQAPVGTRVFIFY
jgi:L,D-transpeptidase YbiS